MLILKQTTYETYIDINRVVVLLIGRVVVLVVWLQCAVYVNLPSLTKHACLWRLL